MKPDQRKRSYRYECLESRKLLAADFASGFDFNEMMIPNGPAEVIQWVDPSIAPAEHIMFDNMMMEPAFAEGSAFQFANLAPNDFFGASMELPGLNEFDLATSAEMIEMTFIQQMTIVSPQSTSFMGMPGEGTWTMTQINHWSYEGPSSLDNLDELVMEDGFEDGELEEGEFEAIEGEFLDLYDGSDGVFGTLDQENPSSSYSFIAHEDGQASVVLASNADSELNVVLVNGEGNVVEPTSNDSDSEFNKLNFDVTAGEIYELTVNSTDTDPIEFQLTVSLEAADPVDQHTDEVGEDATQLEFTDGFSDAFSHIETEGDRDVFQFTSEADGDGLLFASDLTEEGDMDLSVTIFDSEGEELVNGSTNADVTLEFDTTEGETYYVAIEAGSDQTGSYHVAVANFSDIAEPIEGIDVEPIDLGDLEDVDHLGHDVDLDELVDEFDEACELDTDDSEPDSETGDDPLVVSDDSEDETSELEADNDEVATTDQPENYESIKITEWQFDFAEYQATAAADPVDELPSVDMLDFDMLDESFELSDLSDAQLGSEDTLSNDLLSDAEVIEFIEMDIDQYFDNNHFDSELEFQFG